MSSLCARAITPEYDQPLSASLAGSAGTLTDRAKTHTPATYTPPTSRLEIAICRFLFKLMLRSNRIHITFESAQQEAERLSCAEFVLVPPNLITTIKMMFAPNLWVGE